MTTSVGTTTYSYNQADQLLEQTDSNGAAAGYTYDQRGNLTKVVSTAGIATYSWTPDDRLSQVALPGKPIVGFTYDANGLRRTKTIGSTTTTYAYEQGNLVSETTPGVGTTSYTYNESGAPLTITVPSGATYTYHYTESGNVAELTDTSHNIIASYTYDAWGNVVDSTGSQSVLDANPVLYRGMYGVLFDKETGLLLAGARYYDAKEGVFLSVDPSMADPPQSSYMYARNDPVDLLDPTGLYACGDSDCRSNDLHPTRLRLPWDDGEWHRAGGKHQGNYYGEGDHQERYNGHVRDGYALDWNLKFRHVRAVADGKVVDTCKSNSCGYGWHIFIRHNINGKIIYSRYGHLSAIYVKDGDYVYGGELIGKSGNTGRHTTGAHLHFFMYSLTQRVSNLGQSFLPEPISGYKHIKAYTCYRPEGGSTKSGSKCTY
jgi:RHS repeat-associated protein